MSFAALGLQTELVQILAATGVRQPTPVQVATLPAALAGQDLLVQAPTGSGKTLAYALPLLQQLVADRAAPAPGHRATRALVLVPTRELAQQVGELLSDLAFRLARQRGLGPAQALRQRTLVGGVSINPQLMALRGGADLVVATPGRLLDVLAHNGLVLNGVQQLVLDEADRLLDLGFAAELQALRARLPTRRQSLLVSATLSAAVQALAADWLHGTSLVTPAGVQPAAQATPSPATGPATQPAAPDEPGHANADGAAAAPDDSAPLGMASTPAPAGGAAAHPDITQRALQVDTAQRTPLLRQLLKQHGWRQLLVFVATRHATEHLAHKLAGSGIAAAALHGNLAQGARSGAWRDFRDGRLQVLVATDLAARGLDLQGLPAVLNYDLPRSADDQVHRIGRTGRAGQPGLAISFICADSADGPNSEAHFRLIEKRQQQRLPREQLPGFEPATVALPQPGDGAGGIKGSRPSKKDKLRAQRALRD